MGSMLPEKSRAMMDTTREAWSADAATFEKRMVNMGLDPSGPDADGIVPDPPRLRAPFQWAVAWRRLRSRQAMLKHGGYPFPPLRRGSGADEDWKRFEQWMNGAHRGGAA